MAMDNKRRVKPLNSEEVRQRGRLHRYGTIYNPPPFDPDIVHPTDDDHSFFANGRDFENIYTNHLYTAEERKTLNSYESLDYLPSHSPTYCAWIRRQPRRLDWDRWLMMAFIGFAVGLLGFFLHQFIDLFSELKWEKAQELLHDLHNRHDYNGLARVWGFVLGYSLIFGGAAAAIIIIRPSATGSGIPELIGFLNGTVVRHIFNIKTLVAKFFSCCFAVGGAGMPVGPEGPMIHMGALIGAGISQFKSDTLKVRLPFFERFRNSEDRRNFVSAGAAAGVSAAFGAPVGGLLFSMEEVSSFWNHKLSWQTFFCCMVSTVTTDLFNSAFQKFNYRGHFGLFKLDNYILFNVHKGISVNVLVFLPTAVLGLCCGVLGALFTIINLKMARLRRRLFAQLGNVSVHLLRTVRFGEPLLLVLIFSTISVMLPAAFRCSNFTCAISDASSTTERRSENCLTDNRNPLHVEPTVSRYLCPPGVSNGSAGSSGRVWTNESYNEAATLLFLTGERAIRHLFSRNTHFEFGYTALAVVLVLYFFLACWASGTAVSSGLVVPMLMIGGLVGRIVGLALVDIVGIHSDNALNDSYWSWIDPGAFALIGAAAFFGGVSRLTMSLTVIMMEITNDVQFLLPIMVGIMTAKWMGDLITHPLYHSLLELKCIPFLDFEPVVMHKRKAVNLELFKASHVMTSPVVTVRIREKVSVLAEILLSCTHSGFPVVAPHFELGTQFTDISQRSMDPSDERNRLVGTITRLELIVLLKTDSRFVAEDAFPAGPDEDADGEAFDYPSLCLDKLMNADEVTDHLQDLATAEVFKNQWIDLGPVVNRSAVRVCEDFSLHRTYILVRSLGLRHLVVTDVNNRVRGIITRKDLMGFRVEERLEPLLREEMEFREYSDPEA